MAFVVVIKNICVMYFFSKSPEGNRPPHHKAIIHLSLITDSILLRLLQLSWKPWRGVLFSDNNIIVRHQSDTIQNNARDIVPWLISASTWRPWLKQFCASVKYHTKSIWVYDSFVTALTPEQPHSSFYAQLWRHLHLRQRALWQMNLGIGFWTWNSLCMYIWSSQWRNRRLF